MSEAPERMLLTYMMDRHWYAGDIPQPMIKPRSAEYIRADLHQAAIDRIAALEAQVKAAERKDLATPMRHFLHWIADRLVMHGDRENADFVLSLRDRADKLDAALRALTGKGK
jgi:hypothetical protein